MLVPALLAVLAMGAADVKETPRVLVLDLDAANMPVAEARAVDALVVANARVDGITLVTQRELQKLAELDAAGQQIGCDTSSCLAEMAGALGARYVLFGSASRLGQSVTVSLSMFDASTSATNRDALTVTSLDALADRLPARVQALVQASVGPLAADPAVDATIVQPEPGPAPLFVAGVVTTVAGGVAIVGGGLVAGYGESIVNTASEPGQAKRDAQTLGIGGLIGAGAGVVVTAVGITLMVIGSGE